MALEDYVRQFQNLRVNTAHGHPSPHKCVMLLAVIQLFDEGRIGKNQIQFGSELLDAYRAFFQVVAGDGDHPNPYFPFFHLQGSDSENRFWHLVAASGRERELAALTSARSIGAIEKNVAYVELDPDPTNKKYWPRRDALEWRMEHLLSA